MTFFSTTIVVPDNNVWLSIEWAGLVEKRGFRRKLSTETGLFVEKQWLMKGLSTKGVVLVEMMNFYERF